MSLEWSGRLEKDAAWEGEVRVAGDVVVPAGVTLRVEPGARILFAPRPRWACAVFRSSPEGYPIEASSREACDLVVQGTLDVLGTPGRPAVFGADGGVWGGLTWLRGGRGRLSGARLQGGGESCVQAFDDSVVDLEDCRLEGAETGVRAWGLSRVRLRRVDVRASRCGVLCCEGSRVELDDVAVEDAPQGCSAEGWSLVRARRCRFSRNTDFAVSARHHSWVRLDSCRSEDCAEAAVRLEEARIDA